MGLGVHSFQSVSIEQLFTKAWKIKAISLLLFVFIFYRHTGQLSNGGEPKLFSKNKKKNPVW